MEVGIEDCLHIEFEYNRSKCAFFVNYDDDGDDDDDNDAYLLPFDVLLLCFAFGWFFSR